VKFQPSFYFAGFIVIFTKKLFLKLHHNLNSYPKSPSAITIGTFDGVHLGHQKQTVAKKK